MQPEAGRVSGMAQDSVGFGDLGDLGSPQRHPQLAVGWGQCWMPARALGTWGWHREGLQPSLLPPCHQAGNWEQPLLKFQRWAGCSEPFGGGSTAGTRAGSSHGNDGKAQESTGRVPALLAVSCGVTKS